MKAYIELVYSLKTWEIILRLQSKSRVFSGFEPYLCHMRQAKFCLYVFLSRATPVSCPTQCFEMAPNSEIISKGRKTQNNKNYIFPDYGKNCIFPDCS